jgi:uncharacterized protein (DUF362 family)
MSGEIDRRIVLKRLAQAGLVLGGSGVLAALGTFLPGRFRANPKLADIPDHGIEPSRAWPPFAVARGPDPARLVRASIDAIGGMGRFVRPGETVLLKPNMAWDRTVDQAANTHPAVVGEVARLCREARAGRVVVAEVPIHDGARAAERSGIRRAAEDAGAELLIPPHAGFVDTRLAGVVLDHWEVFAPLFHADRVINLPIVKDHALTGLTCGLKNWYGLLGGTRARLHQDIHHAIIDVASAVRPTLTVVDATRVMVRGGPTGGRLEDVRIENAVAAGTDAVALDAWGAGLLGLDPSGIRYLAVAEGRGLGSIRAGTGRIVEIHAGA